MLQLKVEAVKWELRDTATFYLSEVSGRKVAYKAGQFITLVFDHHDEEIRRSYSLSSSPDELLLSITVKRIENGEISRFLLTKIRAGDVLKAVEPAGKFIITGFAAKKDVLLFAAESGIVPIFSQLKDSVLFYRELNSLQSENPDRLSIIHLLSSEGNRLNNLMAEKLVRENVKYNMAKAEFYTCGPFTYMRMIRLT